MKKSLVDLSAAPQPGAGCHISATDLGKTYRVYDAPVHRLVEGLTRRKRHREHHALSGISFELAHGESLGVVGQNGAGKSTLLKLLAGVLEPSAGELEVSGTVSSILELGAGFHPDFTGRQNIRINAAMLGLTEVELERRLPAIEQFCELGDFLDQPVKVYSSGMSMRLAFAIATQIEPDILIIDEALSVGDGYFQKKCMDRILELIAGGTSLLFCSHAMYYVSTLCQRVLWLRDGEVAAYGRTDEVVQKYEEHLLEQQAAGEKEAQERAAQAQAKGEEPTGNGESRGETVNSVAELASSPRQAQARITSVRLLSDGREVLPEDGLRPEQSLTFDVEWTCADQNLEFQVGVGVDRMDGIQVFGVGTRGRGLSLVGKKRYKVRFTLNKQPLLRGQFTVHAFLLDEKGLHVFDHRVLHDAFRVAPPKTYEFGMLRVPCQVQVLDPDTAPSE